MSKVGLLLALSIMSFLGALAQTAGVVAFFGIEQLEPYKWHLVIGGTLAILLAQLLIRSMNHVASQTDGGVGSNNTDSVGR